jgi:hypothetical protein
MESSSQTLLLEEISGKLDKIIRLLEDNVVKDCNKMRNHINFVESVYDVVKGPFNSLLSFNTSNQRIEN